MQRGRSQVREVTARASFIPSISVALVCRRHDGLWDFQQISLHERGISFPPRMTGATCLSVHIVRRRLLMKTDYHLAREQQLRRTMGTIWAGMKMKYQANGTKWIVRVVHIILAHYGQIGLLQGGA